MNLIIEPLATRKKNFFKILSKDVLNNPKPTCQQTHNHLT